MKETKNRAARDIIVVGLAGVTTDVALTSS